MMPRRSLRQAGFTLLETLLVVGVLSIVLAGAYTMFDGWAQRAQNRQAASEILRLQQAAEDFVYSNFDRFTPQIANVFQEMPLSVVANDVFLPSSYVPRNAFKQTMRMYRRILKVPRLRPDGTAAVDLTGAPILLTSVEVLTVTDNPSPASVIRIPNQRLLDTAQAGGPKMGIWSQIAAGGKTYSGRITSPFNDWYLSNPTTILPGYTAAPDPFGGYIAAYGVVNAEDTGENDAWLYRIEVPGRPELNQMETDLRMNGNWIADVGSMSADRVNVTGNAAFRGSTTGTSGAETSQAMTLDQALRIDGNGTSRIDMATGTTTCGFSGTTNRDVVNTATGDGTGCTLRGGELNVIAPATYNLTTGVVTAQAGNARLDATTLTIDGSVITDHTDVTGTTTARGGSNFQTVNGTTMLASGTVIAPTTNIMSTTATTRALQVANVDLFDTTTADRLAVGGAMIAARVVPTGTQGFSTERLEIGNTAILNQNLRVNQLNVTKSLDITTGMASGNYHDTVVDRDVRCTLKATNLNGSANGKTYCEPTGLSQWTWNGRYFDQQCSTFSSGEGGYVCSEWETNSAHSVASRECIGRCFYYRDAGGINATARHSDNPTCTYGPSAC